MKKIIKYTAIALAATMLTGAVTSCVGDLDVKPIDPNLELPDDVLNSQDAFTALLAKCYQGLSCSGSEGPDKDGDIEGVNSGYGQYMRAVFNMEELSTDVAACCWNDGNLFDIHNINWNASNEFVLSMYYRIYFQIGLCNEFIRRSNASDVSDYTLKNAYIAEARALRLFSYYHAIDMFGNVPFATEEQSVGSTGAEQISRADLFDWMVDECNDLLDGSDLAEPGKNEYGRCDKGMVQMILAKLYLNAEVWKGTAMYSEAAEVCEKIINEYPLHTKSHGEYSAWRELFMADNHLWSANTTYNGDEIIFVVEQDGILVQSYGATNYLIFGSTGGNMDAAAIGISKGWGGLSMTGAFTSKFEDGDVRATFYEGKDDKTGKVEFEQFIDALRLESNGWSNGWKSMKFLNVNHDGTNAQANGFADTDWPVFRSADAYLMYAECAARGAADKTKGQNYLDAVRARAGVGSIALTLDNIIDERGRELYYEGFRRQDLIRFGLFTSDKYLWEFKGGVQAGKAVDEHFNLYPITSGELNANGNLKQNPGY